VVPCHQGRSAENLFFSTILKKGDYVPNNTHFDTTRANTLHKGGMAVDFPCEASNTDECVSFKGNMDVEALEQFIHEKGTDKIPVIVMTVTQHHIPFFFDCARFAENSYFIKRDEPGYADKSIRDIAHEMFEQCDGVMMSAKKDGLANIGGFIAVNDEDLYRRLTELLIIVEGFMTYGGLAGRDLEVLAVGLEEVLEFDYLDFRVEQVRYFGERIKEAGIPIVEPIGGHAVFADAGKFLSHIPAEQFPGQTLTVALYLEGGVRAVEIGSLMFGGEDPNTGEKLTARRELVRMAVPRRVYTNSHLDYVADAAARIAEAKDKLGGYKITRQAAFLRHFTCEMEQLAPSGIGVEMK
jgi:tryptophanase